MKAYLELLVSVHDWPMGLDIITLLSQNGKSLSWKARHGGGMCLYVYMYMCVCMCMCVYV